jgi:hypothetical protein
MAGGKLVEARGERGRLLYESHQMLDAELEESEAQLARSPCDFVEFHCMLIRNELLREGATVLDPAIRCIHEHIDVALAAKQRGYPVFIEPKARVNYLAFAEYLIEDLPIFRKRWSAAVADADIAVFCRKWNVVDDARAFGVRNFVRDHLAQIDPLRAASPLFADRAQPMQREEFAQSRSALLDLALARGYSSAELTLISDAYHVAQVLMDGGYRPCGRPFINHLAGTASVLIRYGFRVEMIAAGLLHSVYTHCPAHPGGPQAALETVQSWLGGKDSALERRVRAYSLRGAQDGGLLDPDASAGLFVLDSEVIALLAANEIDQHLSGEFRYANRDDQLEAPALQAIEQVGRILGVEGLAETLLQALREQGAPVALPTRMRASYRIGADRRSAVPMMSNVLAALAAEDPM